MSRRRKKKTKVRWSYPRYKHFPFQRRRYVTKRIGKMKISGRGFIRRNRFDLDGKVAAKVAYLQRCMKRKRGFELEWRPGEIYPEDLIAF